MIGTPSNRFCSSGLVAATAACVAGVTAVLTANAAIVFTDNVNCTVDPGPISSNSSVVYPASTSDGFGLNGYIDDKSGTDTASIIAVGDILFVGVARGSSVVGKLSSGVSIGSSSFFDNIDIVSGYGIGLWNRGDDGYFGFEFNPSGSLVLYGWGHLARSATGTDTVSVTQYAYDNSGAAILAGDTGLTPVPEPTDYAIAAGVGLMALAGGRHWHRRFYSASGRIGA
jgi:hypothetical protein